jgi:sulfide dehydrogenase [flavocytochrome c] flavoprotein subunit
MVLPWPERVRKGFGSIAGLPSLAKTGRTDRRRFLASAASIAAVGPLGRPAIGQNNGVHVIVVGGGFGGASCARALKQLDAQLQVTLIEQNKVYMAAPMSNAVIAGLRDIKLQQFDYTSLGQSGVAVVYAAITDVDPHARTLGLSSGAKLGYERLVVSPGIDFRWSTVQGYDEQASKVIPHAWKDAAQVDLLRRQLETMRDGGTVVISVPVNPARCPPAPYERASLIAYYLKAKKPRSKVIVLDAKENFTMQKLFQNAWDELYSGLIEWISISVGGALASVDVATKTLSTDFEKYKADVANIIPPQTAGRAAQIAGVADRTGWCPVDPVTFESKLQPNIHVIGDAALAGAMPRSASAASSQAKICASAIVKLLNGETPETPILASSCYSLITPDYAISQFGRFRPENGQYVESHGTAIVSPVDATRAIRRDEAQRADDWYRSITSAVFG